MEFFQWVYFSYGPKSYKIWSYTGGEAYIVKPVAEVAVEPDNEPVGAVVLVDSEVKAGGEVEVLNRDFFDVDIRDQLGARIDDILVHELHVSLPEDLVLHVPHVDAVYVVPEVALVLVKFWVVDGSNVNSCLVRED